MKALITGITGQDGHYLSDLLNDKGYEVFGLVRRSSQPRSIPGCEVIEGDVTDPGLSLPDVDEVYHLAAQSHVGLSFKTPHDTIRTNLNGTLNMLEHARKTKAKFYQASTSELFGSTPPPQNELSMMHPRSPYGVSKLASYWLTINYREAYGMDTYNGILFNHESPLRGDDFVTQKICRGLADIKAGKTDHIKLGNMAARRDWGHAKDYVRGMWQMMSWEPGEYVLATGKTHAIIDFLDLAFDCALMGSAFDYVRKDESLYRPAEVECLCGDPSKAEANGWVREYTFEDMVKEMVDAALKI